MTYACIYRTGNTWSATRKSGVPLHQALRDATDEGRAGRFAITLPWSEWLNRLADNGGAA